MTTKKDESEKERQKNTVLQLQTQTRVDAVVERDRLTRQAHKSNESMKEMKRQEKSNVASLNIGSK